MVPRFTALFALSVGIGSPAFGQSTLTRPLDNAPPVVWKASTRPIGPRAPTPPAAEPHRAADREITPVRQNLGSVVPASPPADAKPALPDATAGAPAPGCPVCWPALGDCPTPCGPAGRAWANFEWLYWVASGQPLPPLAVTAPPGAAGTIDDPTTGVLFGGRRANNDFRNGFRVSGGVWLNPDQTCGLEGEFFFLGRSRELFAAGSDGSQALGRPFFNALTGRPDAELVSFPGVLAGTLSVDSRSSAIGGGVNAVRNLCCDPCGRVDLLVGYRYFNLTDEVTIQEDLTALGGTGRVPPGFRFQIADRFRTENDFHGGVIGVAAERRYSALFVGLRASVALGANRQVTDIEGGTVSTPPGGPAQALPGGLLALSSNIGHYERTAFAVMPQVGLRAGVQLTDHVRVYAGYDFLYLSNVLRAGDQIDPRVNPNLLPPARSADGPALPAFPARSTDFWMQGVSVGVQVRY